MSGFPYYIVMSNSSCKKHPRDRNVLAKDVVNEATGQNPLAGSEEEQVNSDKDPNAVKAGRLGGLKGGKARARKLTADERRAIAKKSANARWQKTSD